ncbi:MAG: hypothetical protein SGJ27_12245 [Candidatus Melainabacteria bacterium]|nr:hypothetical protein [Candidatus Melainabacteria bacterium]
MKGTQLIPSSVEEDSRAISVEPIGTGLAPTMQVSLAKRIIQPGTNRVVCLAAQTTVPMEADDIASCSDLALRLSDGTNVKVSMSFFNDVALGAGFDAASQTAFEGATARRVYDPDWYDANRAEYHREKEGSLKLLFVFAALCAVTLGSFVYFIPGGIDRLAAEIVAKMPPLPAPIFPKQQLKTEPTVAQTNSTPTNLSQPNKKGKRSYGNRTAKAQSNKSTRKAGRASQNSMPRVARSSSFGSGSGLIPPPPPTAYAIPVSQMAMYNAPPYAMPSIVGFAPAKNISSAPKNKFLNLEIPKQAAPSVPVSVPVTAKLPPSSRPALSQQTQALFPEPARAYSHPRRSSTSYSEKADNSSATMGGAAPITAPVPGDRPQGGQQPQLERIELY